MTQEQNRVATLFVDAASASLSAYTNFDRVTDSVSNFPFINFAQKDNNGFKDNSDLRKSNSQQMLHYNIMVGKALGSGLPNVACIMNINNALLSTIFMN